MLHCLQNLTIMATNQHREHREHTVHNPSVINSPTAFAGKDLEERMALYNKSIADPSAFWAGIAKEFTWKREWNTVVNANFSTSKGDIAAEWFIGGVTNLSYNCVDRWVEAGQGDRVAFICEGNEPHHCTKLTYKDLQDRVIEMAAVLKEQYGVVKGDRVTIYSPMIAVGPIAMLAAIRIGAVCNVVFAGFSAQSLASRMVDSNSSVIITANGNMRGDKPIPLKGIVDEAIGLCAAEGLKVRAIVYRNIEKEIPMIEGRDVWLHDAVAALKCREAPVEWVDAEHPSFMLYTSGSTGKPKGLIHSTGGYMVYAATTFKYVFDYKPEDVYFCTADIGWITGHSYVTFGPLLNCATSVLFEGVPSYPDASRWWHIVDKHNVSLYTAPTAIRSLIRCGDEYVNKSKRSSLRVLGSVGEPINEAAWDWYYDVIGNKKADICDSWWQTETGGIMITPLPGNTPMKPGSATLPFLGIEPAVLDPATGKEVTTVEAEGLLCIKSPWPGQARTIYGDHDRYVQTYFCFDGFYYSGDGCRRDADGYYWLTGRVDDVVNVSGHRMGTSEIECAINSHPAVAESAVVGFPHDIKGEGIYAYVCFKPEFPVTPELLKEVSMTVRKVIGPIATPDFINPATGLPKTRSGKIMRRILRKVAANQLDELGDISTLADPNVVQELLALKKQWIK